jgi:hypothetical protein
MQKQNPDLRKNMNEKGKPATTTNKGVVGNWK